MIYSTIKCPNCRQIVHQQTNPTHEIDCPFEKCPTCGKIYCNPYKEEWITKTPLQRLFFFIIKTNVWARAIMIPWVIAAPIFGGLLGIIPLMIIMGTIGTLAWFIIGYILHKRAYQPDIDASILRTQQEHYVSLLKSAGYKIYPLKSASSSADEKQ